MKKKNNENPSPKARQIHSVAVTDNLLRKVLHRISMQSVLLTGDWKTCWVFFCYENNNLHLKYSG